MAKTPPKTVKKKLPQPKTHPLEPVLKELVDQVTLIADAAKAGAVRHANAFPLDEVQFFPAAGPPVIGEDPSIGPPPSDPPVGPPPPPPVVDPDPCNCSDQFVKSYLDFLKNSAKPLVKCYPTWDPAKPDGQRWEWTAE